jgi:hypothetical protein
MTGDSQKRVVTTLQSYFRNNAWFCCRICQQRMSLFLNQYPAANQLTEIWELPVLPPPSKP